MNKILSQEDIKKIFKGVSKDEFFISNNKSVHKKILNNIQIEKINLENKSIRNISRLAFNYFKISKYKCFNKKCSIKNIWLSKPIKLILINKNHKIYDHRIDNIELYCPNCYFSLFETNQLEEIISENKIKCKFCDYQNLQQLGKYYVKNQICKVCSKKKTQAINIEDELNNLDLGLNKQELDNIDEFLLEEKLRKDKLLPSYEELYPENNRTDSHSIFNNYDTNSNIQELLKTYNSSNAEQTNKNLIDNQINIINEELDINELLDF